METETQYVFCGAGCVGRDAARKLRAAGVDVPVCFADNDWRKWGTIDDVSVMGFDHAVSKYPTATFVVTCTNQVGAEIYQQLAQMDGGHVTALRYNELRYRFPSILCPSQEPEALEWMRNHRRDVLDPLCRSLADRESQLVFWSQVMWRDKFDPHVLPPSSSIAEMYFPSFIRRLEDNASGEVFLDGGAYDGDTVREFLKRWKNFRFIWACEPDPSNAEKMRPLAEELNQSRGLNSMAVLRKALTEHSGPLPFCARGTMSSSVLPSGSSFTQGIPIDQLGPRPTYIKMDIEGEELSALRGAAHTIENIRPALAICAYHRAEDLWTIPQFMFEHCKDYRVFLRHYGEEEDIDIIYYAVPEERFVA